MPRRSNAAKVALQKYTGLSRQAIDKRFLAGSGTKDFHDHTARKMKAAADLKEEQAARAKIERKIQDGSLVLKKSAVEHGRRIGAIFSAELTSFRNNAPGKLAGLNQEEIYSLFESECDLLLSRTLLALDQAGRGEFPSF
jgi:hypothetical protein